jgi:hypothetical protein
VSVQVVTVACPACGYAFVAGHIVPGAWWAQGVTPEKVAAVPYCPQCECRPPMRVVDAAGVQGELFPQVERVV